MKVWFTILFTAIIRLAATDACASVEGFMPLSTFNIGSNGIGESGPVTISGVQGPKGITTLSIRVFNKEYTVKGEQLKDIQAFSVNGLQLSFEQGWKGSGGRTIYIVLSQGFTSGILETRVLAVSEEDGVSVEKMETK